jgi:hypothetical protein
MPIYSDAALEGYTDSEAVSNGPFGPSGQRTPTYIEILERLRLKADLTVPEPINCLAAEVEAASH